MGSGIAPHKKLYDGPSIVHGQSLRSDFLHVKGHGKNPGGHKSSFKTQSRDKFLGAKRLKKKAERMLLNP
jgi:hypothetical protein